MVRQFYEKINILQWIYGMRTEAKKYGCGVNYALKITNATGKWFQQQLEYITILLQSFAYIRAK